MKQPYLEKARAGRVLTMNGKPPALTDEPPTPRAPRAPVEPNRIAENVRLAPDEAAAWGVLGATIEVPLSPIRRQLNDEAMELDHRIAKGQKVLAEYPAQFGEPPPPAWVDKLIDLHAEQLDKLYDLDRVRVFEAEHLGIDVGTLCACILHRMCSAAEAYLNGSLPDTDGAAALERLCQEIDADEPGCALEEAKTYVAAAVRHRYGGTG